MTPTTTSALGAQRMRLRFRAVVRAVAPSSSGFGEERWAHAEDVVGRALAQRPASVRRQVRLFLRVLDALAFLRFGRGLARLDAGEALRLLRALERSPLLLLRRGVWGVRTLAFMGCWTHPDARREIGYRARLRGWDDRGGTQGAWPGRAGAAPAEPWVLLADAEARDA
jgi:hypothetical protein